MALDYIALINEAVQAEKLSKSKQRRREVEELLNFYTGTNTEHYIEGFFSPDIYLPILVILVLFILGFFLKINFYAK